MKTFATVCVLAILIGFSACVKSNTYPDTPSLKVLSATLKDSSMVHAVLEFTDGDGDIGLAAGDTFPPYDTVSKYHNNLIVDYFEMQNGTWVKNTQFKYRIQPITPAGKNKTLEGEMEIDLFFNTFSPFDTVKYSFQLYDRALHESNVAESEGLVVPK